MGLDVHVAKVVAAILDSETGELRFLGLGGESDSVVNLCSSLPGPVRATYEAGPTGYGLARGLGAAGVDCLASKVRGNNWTTRHLEWLSKLQFDDPAAGPPSRTAGRRGGDASPKR